MTLDELNALPDRDARDRFISCCGSSRWANEMVVRRPFASLDELYRTSDTVWGQTRDADWREAFSHHPRIGERSSGWAAGEQSGMRDAADNVRDELERVNREYEEKFGHIYIVCAAGRTADEMLAMAMKRMQNDAADELAVAAEEQRKITQLRLRKLLGETT